MIARNRQRQPDLISDTKERRPRMDQRRSGPSSDWCDAVRRGNVDYWGSTAWVAAKPPPNAAAQTRTVSTGEFCPSERKLSRHLKYMARARIP